MYVQKDEVVNFLEMSLTEIRNASTPCAQERCPHCGVPIRFPIIVKQSDIDLFHSLMESAYGVLDRHGVTAKLFAEIAAEAMYRIALKKS